MKSVVFLSKHKYPFGDASSKRNICLSKYFYEKGYDVVFIGMGNTNYKEETQIDKYKIVSMRKHSSKFIIFRILNHLFIERRILSFAKKKYKETSLWIVDPKFYKLIRKDKFFKSRKVVYTVVEYYSACNYKYNGLFSKSYRENVFFNEQLKKEEGSVIAISSFLKENFKSRNINAVRIPFVIDSTISLSEFDVNKNYQNNKTFIYCGNPRRKDLLDKMIRGFLLLPEKEYYQCKTIVCGVNAEWLLQYFNKEEIKKINKVFTFKGYVPYKNLLNIYKEATFSILLRPSNERYAMAGFPTKITEALEYGVIPITNYTSDLSLYLEDGINSLEVLGDDENAFCDAIKKAINLNDKTITKLRKNARDLCFKKLDIKHFYNELDSIVND
ncbi:MAG: glycosyltransferase family 4 protein [Bacilli bacterium]|jgi:glycosyltransferase involved in cell wall biosynthesis|nr:glycosyltransferase family 4 protein [Bacilli bacterium]